ncbi:SDR family oxidoreductase [Sphingomicrobium astaxanthinifaciens]|uniref:SDR family oxidoreductase n=1 Tax=Sphingomicrobium astaxanthinifaciens TaxID=1227949 RepID=UPI001FCAB5CA|nr:SDR family oxidoreductase [Sphingomicrobium astaxanthinifaciens]MCJ7421092.1 SDR family oxidoreductase [Sphingomicrobium astaxanthinifaciens]
MPTVLITGANRGIGRALTEQYAGAGWDVIATARADDDIAELDRIEGVRAHRLDVKEAGGIDRLVGELGDAAIDVFINNAGIYGPREPEREGWLELMEVNVIAPTLLALALRSNVARSDHRKMVVLTSKMGSIADNGSGGSIPYRSSKAAVNAAWKSLAHDLRDEGIAVAMLHPGWVETDMGGPNALIDTATSAAGLRQRIEETGLDNTGRFVAYDGQEIPW